MNRPDLGAHLDQVLIGEPEPGRIVLVDSDPAWPVRYEHERARIADALGALARRIEHIGSTSVPGLAAKPIVDILVTVADADDESSFLPRLEGAGFVLRIREPTHRLLRTPDRRVHVHVWSDSSPEADRYLIFRDRLRAAPGDRAAYERVKRGLATREWDSIDQYADAKGPLVDAILARAPT